MLTNLHTHTFRCRHARGEDREYVEAAIAAGLRTLGFSDHCPRPRIAPLPPEGFRSYVRMDPEEAPGYFESILALREEYKDRIEIFVGFELEHLPSRAAEQEEFLAQFPLDYLILGQHFFGDEWASDYCGEPTADEARLARYVERCVEALETGRYLYLAHPDLLRFTGPDPAYALHMGRLCDYLRERGCPVEVNLLGLSQRRHYPSERFLRIAAEHGCSATIAVDAHDPASLRGLAPVEAQARALCEKCGLPVVEPPRPSLKASAG